MFIIRLIMARINKKEKMIDLGPLVISPNQLSMFPDYRAKETARPERPTILTIDKEPIFNAIAELVFQWSGETNRYNYVDFLKTTQKIFKNGEFYDDAYIIAKEYEKAGCEVDADLVSELDDVSSISRDELKKQVKDWVLKHNIQPIFQVGDTVFDSRLKNGITGSIVRIYPETAEVGIKLSTSSDFVSTRPQEIYTHIQTKP